MADAKVPFIVGLFVAGSSAGTGRDMKIQAEYVKIQANSLCPSVAQICKANNSNFILFLSLTKNRSRCCKNVTTRKQEKEGWVWTDGVLGQTAELCGEVLTWAQVGWWTFAHFTGIWAIFSGCAGLSWYNGTLGTVEPHVVSGPYMPLLFYPLCKSEALLLFECRW